MNTLTYNGHEIRSVYEAPTVRRALARAEREGIDAASRASGVDRRLVSLWSREAGIIDRYGRHAMKLKFVDASARAGDAFISFYATDGYSFMVSQGARQVLDLEKGDKIRVAIEETDKDTHFYVVLHPPDGGDITIVNVNNTIGFNCSMLAHSLGISDTEESLRFMVDHEPTTHDGMTLYKATLKDQ